ncbi:MAG TPA: YihY/virulence factor BrkB family protein, partial [Tianweitania sediminis]|nr:YihY/virulence factor BrkB family protein [Tianweitania sediminis]
MTPARIWAATRKIVLDAYGHFDSDDGWSMASHLALSAILAMFPFLIFAAALGSFLGASAFADTAVHLAFDTWPEAIAEPIAQEAINVLTVQRGDFLTVSVIAAAIFASNGVEALRVSLNRAYRVSENRSFLYRRMQSFMFVCIATIGIVVISTLLVVAPLVASFAEQRLVWIDPSMIGTLNLWRYIIAATVIVLSLMAVHFWLPAGKRKFIHVLPGIAFTLVAWIAGSTLFASYLARFSTYVTTYAGLASIMVAIVFLYILSCIFILGGELNASIRRYREARRR